jgi:tetratricopeptide (TPR) repeat protein
VSKNLNRKSNRAGRTKPALTADPSARLNLSKRARWIVFAPLLAIGVGAFLVWPRLRQVSLPEIPTARLDEAAARLVELHLNQVRASRRSAKAWGDLGSVLRSLEIRKQARYCYEIAERLDPRQPRWPYLNGLLLAETAPAESLAALGRAVKLCGSEPDAPRLRLAKVLAETGQWEEAEIELRELLRARPDNTAALLALARVAQARGELAEAVSLASRCANDLHTARAAWTLLGLVQQRLGDTNAARSAMQRSESLPPDTPTDDPFAMEAAAVRGDPRGLSDRAQRLLSERKLAEAESIIRRLIREQPRFSEGWLLLGRMQLLQKQPSAAEQSIRRHLALEPQSVQGLFQLGMVCLIQERYTEAVTAFGQTTELKPDHGAAFYNLGLALTKSGRKSDALPAFRQAIRHNPERIDSYLLLADLHWQLGEIADAAERLRQAEELDPSDPRIVSLRNKWTSK